VGPGLESGFGTGLETGLAISFEIALGSGFGMADGLDFNGLDAGLWDGWTTAVLSGLSGFFATALRAFVAGALSEVFAPPRAAFAVVAFRAEFFEDPLEDFLRVFLDIRLPFVAFGGSIIAGIAGLPASRNRSGCWASLMASEYASKHFDAPPVRSLIVFIGPDDEQGY